jgi:hypothetical protein
MSYGRAPTQGNGATIRHVRRALAEEVAEPAITQKVFMDVSVGGKPAGRIVLGVFG